MTEENPQDSKPTSAFHPSRSLQDFIIAFLIITLTLNAVGLLWMGVVTGRVNFSGNVDASLVTGVLISVAMIPILRFVFSKQNV
jgi:hypothetical protein